MCVCEGQAGHGVCERVCVEGVRHVGVAMLHAVHAIQNAANQEAVAIETAPKTRAKGPYGLEVSRVKMEEEHHLRVETLRVQRWVEQPQARLIHSKLHFSLCPVRLLLQ